MLSAAKARSGEKTRSDAGARADAADRQGVTPLHVAAMRGYREGTRLLLERGARPDAADAWGTTPLHRAEDASDEPFRSLVSGTSVTVLERADDLARVRTADGEEGWVRSSELTADMPARARLAGLEARIAELDATVAEIDSENQAWLERFERYRGTLPWPWVLGAVLVAERLAHVWDGRKHPWC